MPLFLKVKCLKVKIHDYERKEEGKLNSFNNLEQELFLTKVIIVLVIFSIVMKGFIMF